MSLDHKPYTVRLSIPIGQLKSVLEWCEVCIDDRYKFMEDPLESSFYDDWVFMFDHEQDMTLFVLRWK